MKVSSQRINSLIPYKNSLSYYDKYFEDLFTQVRQV